MEPKFKPLFKKGRPKVRKRGGLARPYPKRKCPECGEELELARQSRHPGRYRCMNKSCHLIYVDYDGRSEPARIVYDAVKYNSRSLIAVTT